MDDFVPLFLLKIANSSWPKGIYQATGGYMVVTNLTKLLTVKEVSSITSLSCSYIYKLVESKQVPHIRIGSQIRFHAQDLNEWITEHTVGKM